MKRFLVFLVIFVVLQASISARDLEEIYNTFVKNLVGKWKSPAWSGQLSESWRVGEDGWLHQQAYYYEGSDTTYRSQSKIERVGNDLILFSVIENSNPKIFKSAMISNDIIVFKNSDYKNPNEVTYVLMGRNDFQRTITGMENDSLVSYTFKFKRTK